MIISAKSILLFGLLISSTVKAQTFSSDTALITINKDTLTTKFFKDKIVLMNFWFIGCYPCMKEIPELNKIALEYKDEVTFIAVNKNNSKEQIEYFIKKFPFSFIQTSAKPGFLDSLKIDLYPTNILYNKNGEVIFRSEGYDENTISSLRKAISNLINTN